MGKDAVEHQFGSGYLAAASVSHSLFTSHLLTLCFFNSAIHCSFPPARQYNNFQCFQPK